MRQRLDRLMVDQGLVSTRSRAQGLIRAGRVFLQGRRLDKAGQRLPSEAILTVKGGEPVWASRAGTKLAFAFSHFDLSPAGKPCLDLGASTGGFTDVLLAGGAALVHAVDVGQGQLVPRLRQDPRVHLHEHCNARFLDRSVVPEPVAFIACDVSFISLRLVLPPALALTRPGAFLVALIKPQFEVGPENVGKGGIVRDSELHRHVCREMEAWVEVWPGWRKIGLVASPIDGADGNREFLIAAARESA